MEKFSVKQRVIFQQRIWFAPLSMMVWHSKNLIGYPLTEYQIREYYDHSETARIRGHLESTRYTYRLRQDQYEIREIDEYFSNINRNDKSKNNEVFNERTQLRNLIIGKETGSDIVVGPGKFKAVFVDKVSGHKWFMTIKS